MQAALTPGISRDGRTLTPRGVGDLEAVTAIRVHSAVMETTRVRALAAEAGETDLPARAAGAAWAAEAAGAAADLAAAAVVAGAFEVAAGSGGSTVVLRQEIWDARENGGGHVSA